MKRSKIQEWQSKYAPPRRFALELAKTVEINSYLTTFLDFTSFYPGYLLYSLTLFQKSWHGLPYQYIVDSFGNIGKYPLITFTKRIQCVGSTALHNAMMNTATFTEKSPLTIGTMV